MDALSEILGGLALKGALFFSAEFSAPWGFSSPPSRKLAPVLVPGTPHLVIYHFVIEGSGVVHLDDGSKLQLEEGDVIVMPHGDAHRMSSREGVSIHDSEGCRSSNRHLSEIPTSQELERSDKSCGVGSTST